MAEYSRFIGLDVHKESVTVAYAQAGRQDPVDYGDVANTPEAVARMVRKLAVDGDVRFCYEAGAMGYGLYRQIRSLGHECVVVAPSLIPRKPGNRVKTNRRDARSLAQLDRSGHLTSVYVPDQTQEAMRDLVRCREDFLSQQRMMRQRLGAFLLRCGRRFDGKAWTQAHLQWLDQQEFDQPVQELVFREYLQQVRHAGQRLEELGKQLERCLEGWALRPLVEAYVALRGVALLTAITLAAELGDVSRFDSPRPMMAFLGLVPSEHSSARRRQGAITKTGNGHVRRALIESSWSYRHTARMTRHLQRKSAGATLIAKEIGWKAQKRLHDRYWHLVNRGKLPVQAVTAVARELCGFVWALGCTAMGKQVTVRGLTGDVPAQAATRGPTTTALTAATKGRPLVAEAVPGHPARRCGPPSGRRTKRSKANTAEATTA
jgi:transposase